MGASFATLDEMLDTRATGTAKRLARDASRDQIDSLHAPDRECVQKLRGIREVAAPGEAWEVGVVRSDRPAIEVRPDKDIEASTLQAER